MAGHRRKVSTESYKATISGRDARALRQTIVVIFSCVIALTGSSQECLGGDVAIIGFLRAGGADAWIPMVASLEQRLTQLVRRCSRYVGDQRRNTMDENDRLDSMARWMWDARQRRQTFCNLPNELRPTSIAEAYAAQEVYYRLAESVYGPVAGAKIATTTKVMQKLMGITHPCGGAIFARTIHTSPAKLRTADFVNLRVESEIALKLGVDLPATGAPWTRDTVAPAVASAMPAFELIEDRHADYNNTDASSLIVENCWNGGIVLGNPQAVQAGDLVGIAGRLSISGKTVGEGNAEDPHATLAWVANHLAGRGRDLKAGMWVITGTLIPKG